MTSASDSSGRPWEGRSFPPTPPSTDDGSAPPELIAALGRLRGGSSGAADVLRAILESRLLVPLIAEDGGASVPARASASHSRGEASQELSIVTVAGPDGRDVLPVFSSVDALRHWNPLARPVPTAAPRAFVAAIQDGTELIVLDPTSPTQFAIRRPAIWAAVQGRSWVPCYEDLGVADAFAESFADIEQIDGVLLAAGDPFCTFAGPELVVTVAIRSGLDAAAVTSIVAGLRSRWEADPRIVESVDSLAVSIRASGQ